MMFGSIMHASRAAKAHDKISTWLFEAGVWDKDPRAVPPFVWGAMNFELPVWMGWDGGHLSHGGTFVRGLSPSADPDPAPDVAT